MNKKGFTLMEMLGVIIILSLLMVLVFPNIVNSVRNSTDKTNKVTEDLVSTALDLYMSDNGYEINSLYFCIPLQQLIDEGYLKKPIKYDDLDDISSVKSVLRFKNNISLIDNDKCLSTILMNYNEDNVFIDPAGNLRFRGKNPNNYVTFNNETWRIIGIVDGHLKLIKDVTIGKTMAWDTNDSNDWTKSSLMKYLNPKDASKEETNGDYWTNLTSEAKNMIEKTTWHLGGFSSNEITTQEAYTYERGSESYNNQPITWDGYVGLMYPSDYGYAASEECMTSKTLSDYRNEICTSSNWLYLDDENYYWTQSPYSSDFTGVWGVGSPGCANSRAVNTRRVRPVVNLKTDVRIESGTGKKNDPYKLEYHKDPVSFETDDWATIAYNVRKGNTDKYTVGATKQVDLGTLGVHTLRIANTTTPSDCKKEGFSQTACGFVIEFADIINTQKMNLTDTNVGGWNNSTLHTYLTNTIYDALPQELKDVIIDTYVVSGHGENDNNNQNYVLGNEKLYLLSPHEVWETGSGNKINNDVAWDNTRQLDYYSNIGVRTDDYEGAIKDGNYWWLRSARFISTDSFYIVTGNGSWAVCIATRTYGVSPAFRIG